MQVHLQMTLPGSEVKEWILIELQGDLESRNEGILSGKFIGDLNFTKQGIPVLIIGHHVLYGKVIPMDKPFVALRKKKEENSMSEDSIEYSIEAVIKKKLLFKSRPKPIILNSNLKL